MRSILCLHPFIKFLNDKSLIFDVHSLPFSNTTNVIIISTGAPILSVDIPSGIDATTGKPTGEYIHANATLALALPKTGLTPKAGM